MADIDGVRSSIGPVIRNLRVIGQPIGFTSSIIHRQF